MTTRRPAGHLIKLGVLAGPTGVEPPDEMDLIAVQAVADTLRLLDVEGYAITVKPTGDPDPGAVEALAVALCAGPDGQDWFDAQTEALRVITQLADHGYRISPTSDEEVGR